jgi:hypothetical protein
MQIPRLPTGSFFPSVLDRRREVEQLGHDLAS